MARTTQKQQALKHNTAKKNDTFTDEEWNEAMEESLREDRELLEKLAKI